MNNINSNQEFDQEKLPDINVVNKCDRCSLCKGKSYILHENLKDRVFGSDGSWSLLRCSNRSCGLIWIHPQPTNKELAKSYEHYYTHSSSSNQNSAIRQLYNKFRTGYLSSRFGYQNNEINFGHKFMGCMLALLPHRRAAFDSSIMWLDAVEKGRVLEIGCGDGERLELLDSLGWVTQGLEPDKKSSDIARSKGLEIVTCDLKDANLEKESFDAIIMSHVVEHLDDPASVLQKCYSLLKPHGKLIMLTPNTNSLGHRWFKQNWLHLDPPRHLFIFNSNSMTDLCIKAGFDKVECKTSVRNANWTLAASHELKKNGRYIFGSLPLLSKIIGIFFLYYEWLIMKFKPESGEDLLVMAHK